MRTYDILHNVVVGHVSTFVATNPIDLGNAKSTDQNTLVAQTFLSFTLPPLLKNKDLFELRTATIDFYQRLKLPPQDQLFQDQLSENFANNMLHAINAITTFKCYFSAVEERLQRYLSNNEGGWVASVTIILENLDKCRADQNIHTFKESMKALVNEHLKGSTHLKPDIHAILDEIPSQRYDSVQEAARGLKQPHHVYEVYKNLIHDALTAGLQQSPRWVGNIQKVLEILEESSKEKDLWEMKKGMLEACRQQLTPSMFAGIMYSPPPVKTAVEGILGEIPSSRYAKTREPIPQNFSRAPQAELEASPTTTDSVSSDFDQSELLEKYNELVERIQELELGVKKKEEVVVEVEEKKEREVEAKVDSLSPAPSYLVSAPSAGSSAQPVNSNAANEPVVPSSGKKQKKKG